MNCYILTKTTKSTADEFLNKKAPGSDDTLVYAINNNNNKKEKPNKQNHDLSQNTRSRVLHNSFGESSITTVETQE